MEPADAIAAIARELEVAGVEIAPPHGPYQGADLLVRSGKQTLPGNDITVYEEIGVISSRHGQWGFQSELALPGPGIDGLEYWAATPQELSMLIIRFFLSEPCLIEGWFVPLHRHPEWSESQLRRSIAQAQGLAWEAWEQVYHQAQEQRRRLYQESDPRLNAHPRAVAWEEWFACLFVPLEPEEARSGEILWVRRDLEVAYRVSTRCPECGREAVVRTGWRSWVRARASHACLACDHSLIRPNPRVPANRSNRHLT